MRHATLLLGGLLSTLTFAIQAHNHDDESHHDGHAHAHTSHHEEHQSGGATLDAHEHGVATLNMVLDGQHLALELESPAANIVGFEHMPSSAEDRATVEQAQKRLQQAESLFLFSDKADCKLEEVETQSPLFAASHDHDEDHDHAQHEDHHDDHHDHEDTHADIDARFHFVCDNPDALKQIDVRLFEVFPNTEKLLLQAITPSGQQGGELTSTNTLIRP